MQDDSSESEPRPSEPTGGKDEQYRMAAFVRPIFQVAAIVAEIGQHEGLAWLLRGLALMLDLAAVWFAGRRRR
jgi:hypothetical protein